MITTNIAVKDHLYDNVIVMLPVQAHTTKTPGLVITRTFTGYDAQNKPKFSDKSWRIVHQPSGYNLMTISNLNAARKAAERFGKLLDWTQPLEVIQKLYSQHSKELCRIRDEARS